jgi:hypothetical protein
MQASALFSGRITLDGRQGVQIAPKRIICTTTTVFTTTAARPASTCIIFINRKEHTLSVGRAIIIT